VRARRFREYYIGRQDEILIEETVSVDGRQYLTGYNREYVRYLYSSAEDLTGRMVTGKAEGFADDETLILTT
jgi:threonylcarbamoyladenosine tRNA methylthiotransferase MtaB